MQKTFLKQFLLLTLILAFSSQSLLAGTMNCDQQNEAPSQMQLMSDNEHAHHNMTDMNTDGDTHSDDCCADNCQCFIGGCMSSLLFSTTQLTFMQASGLNLVSLVTPVLGNTISFIYKPPKFS
jgi:hypothetical protein